MIEESLLSFWPLEGGAQGIGNAALLDQPLTAFFASRQCSGTAIRAAMAWAIEQARNKNTIISGFHSPLEQSVLEVLLTAGAPCVMVIARKLEQSHLPPAWIRAVHAGKSAVVSMDDTTRQLSVELALRRNEWVAKQSALIVIAHVSPGGSLRQQAQQWESNGRIVDYLSESILVG